MTDLAKRLNVPLVWLVNCSGVKLPEQEKFYAGRRGSGILSGMSPKGYFNEEGAEALITAAKQYKAKPPGSVSIHHDETGFFRYVYNYIIRG